MKDFDLSVTICSWNTIEDTRKCLASIDPERAGLSMEVLVVDNASKDGSADMIEREFPWVRLVRSDVNLGFTGGHNLAIRESKGRHVMLLNSDTIAHPGAFAELVRGADSDPEVGILGAKLLNPDGSLQFSCRRFPNPVAALFRNTPLGRLFPNNRFTREYLMTDWSHDQTREVDWVSGAALLLCERSIPSVKELDPSFFMFCEDVDICWRCWGAGFKVRYLPSAVITHKIGGSTSQVADKMIIRFHRSMFRFYRKHQLSSVFILLRPLAYLGAGAALTARAGLFLSKNRIDAFRRMMSR